MTLVIKLCTTPKAIREAFITHCDVRDSVQSQLGKSSTMKQNLNFY